MHWGWRPVDVVVGISRSNQPPKAFALVFRHRIHYDSRQRLSKFWMPTSAPTTVKNKSKSTGSSAVTEGSNEDVNALLDRAGFLRQAYSGIFHLLPLGLRVQEKIELLIDKHMRSIGASKVSLSSISSQELWQQSGRLEKGSEFFTFEDRKGSGFLLSPTHEEEITTLVANEMKSYRDLPIRLYQISRKYRDEKRPRQGLLRGREFLMKDLYTFDVDESQAHATYQEVRTAYSNLFDELNVPYIVAKADSGNMGGDLSHEYHFPNEKGEDDVISCSSCNYVSNEEFVIAPTTIEKELDSSHTTSTVQKGHNENFPENINRIQATTSDRSTVIEAFCMKPRELNPYMLKAIVPNIDLSRGVTINGLAGAAEGDTVNQQAASPPITFAKILLDRSISAADREALKRHVLNSQPPHPGPPLSVTEILPSSTPAEDLNLTKFKTGDFCPNCSSGTLTVQKAIEVGHTFHLGTRYSKPLNATIAAANDNPSTSQEQQLVPVQMGCHGIGISRLLAAIPSVLSTTPPNSGGLNWPRSIAPFEVVVIPGKDQEDAAVEVYDKIIHGYDSSGTGEAGSQVSSSSLRSTKSLIDAVLDDRANKPVGWKLIDADLIGIPVVVVLGRTFSNSSGTMVEVQCRRLDFKENVKVQELSGFVQKLLEAL